MTQVVKAWMSGDPVSIDADASAVEALDLLVSRGIRHLPVVDAERRVVGVLSVDDLRAALPFEIDLAAPLGPEARRTAQDWRVEDVMTPSPHTVSPETSLREAADRMADSRVGCLPVVDPDGRLTAMLSETDLLRALATSEWSEDVRERRRGED